METEITLNDRHEYFVDGKRKPGVNEIVQSVGLIDTRWFTERGAERGTLAHKATELWDRGTLDEDTLDPELKPRLKAWKSYRVATGFKPFFIEEKIYSQLGFCGTIDRAGINRDGAHILLDIKCGEYMWYHPIIMAAYNILVEEKFPAEVFKKQIVHLGANGKYRIEPISMIDISKGHALFLSALSIVNARINAGWYW